VHAAAAALPAWCCCHAQVADLLPALVQAFAADLMAADMDDMTDMLGCFAADASTFPGLGQQ